MTFSLFIKITSNFRNIIEKKGVIILIINDLSVGAKLGEGKLGGGGGGNSIIAAT
tara:strand:- start:3202 stop:3366 length:165 start_codon:yes stop_codon:yes gene_type:complete